MSDSISHQQVSASDTPTRSLFVGTTTEHYDSPNRPTDGVFLKLFTYLLTYEDKTRMNHNILYEFDLGTTLCGTSYTCTINKLTIGHATFTLGGS